MRLSPFGGDQRGNVAVISALALMPIVVTVGGALDMVIAANRLSEIRQGTNAAVLALANLNNIDSTVNQVRGEPLWDYDSAGYARRMMQASVPNFESLKGLEFDVDSTNINGHKKFEITASGHVETNFLRLAGIATIPFSYTAKAEHRVQTAEVSLVLDISSSMNGNRLPQLRNASKTFVDMVLGSSDPGMASISVIPFGGTVNLGPAIFNKFAAETTNPNTILDPDQAQYSALQNDHQTSKFRFTSDYFCLEFPTEDYQDPDAMLTARNYSQVPSFYKWNDFNNWCPTRGAESVFVTEDADKLHQVLDRMSLSDGTGTDVGVLWGYKALSPTWRGEFGSEFSDRPLAYNTETNLKAMVIMTDGGITAQFRPKDPQQDNVHTNRSTVNPPLDYDQPTRRNGKGNSQNQKTIYGAGNRNPSANFGFDPSTPQNSAVDHFLRVCDAARDNDIIVYTISFNLNEGHWANKLMQKCASDTGKHYSVNNVEIEDAFSSIAGSISALRMME